MHTKKSQRRQERKKEATERQKEHNELSFQQRLIKLDLRLGKDLGAAKERKKILRKIEWEKNYGNKSITPTDSKSPSEPIVKTKKKPYQKPRRS
jgi:ABC-type molybdenum transport system ATPase subunit/photorepair protein PhrA